jgi:hypothetical protein
MSSWIVSSLLCRPAPKPKPKVQLAPVESTKSTPLTKGDRPLSAVGRLGLKPAPQQAICTSLCRFDVRNQCCLSGESLVCCYRNGDVYRLEYRRRYDLTYIIFLDSNRVRLASGYHWVHEESRVYCGIIKGSLWGAMIRIGQKPDMIMRFADLFSWDIDFFTECRAGDSFKLFVDQLFCDDRPVGPPRLQVGEYKGRVGEYYGFFYQDPTGHQGYYTQKGEAVRKEFLKSPLQYSRISSYFSSGRMHPILRYVRPHNGVDYVACSGTPVSAIGDGVVRHCGWLGGYGNLVEIAHREGYSSRYGHLSRFGKIRAGSRVTQGQVIGYVGMTGLATGPHLHFEIRINGIPRNPLKIIPPRAPPVSKAYLAEFRAKADSLVRLLAGGTPTPENKAAPPDTVSSDSTQIAPDVTGH